MNLLRLAAAGCAASLMGIVGACAREGAPPGGPVDRRPPVLVRTVPDTFAVVHDFRGPVRFVFDERISEKLATGVSDLDHAVLVSPRTGAVHVSRNRDGVSVSLDGGFRRDLTYRITLLPVLRDLFNNQMLAPIDLVFSTGAKFDTTALAGLVWDRITGDGVPSAVVQAIADSDSLTYEAQTDSAGVYALRYVPAGHYRVLAFQDQNHNGRPDFSEYRGERAARMGPEDTLLLNVPVLRPDTTPARVAGDTALDSVTVAVRFDDYLDPTLSLSRTAVRILRPDSSPGPPVARLFQENEYTAYVEQVRDSFARLDSLARQASGAEREAKDTTAPAPAPAARALPPALPPIAGGRSRAIGGGGREEKPLPNGEPKPGRRIVILLGEPLMPGVAYTLDVSGVVNINGVPLGGGSTALAYTPPDTAKADTAKADTTKTDTTKTDTTGADAAKPDTGATDTGGAGPPTKAGPDTTRAVLPKQRDTTHLVPLLRRRSATKR